MRKMQQKAIEKGKKNSLTETQMKVLEDEQYPCNVYSFICSYFVSCNENGISEEQSINRVYWFFDTVKGYCKKEFNFVWFLIMTSHIDMGEKVEIIEGHLDLLEVVEPYCLVRLIRLPYLDIKQFSAILDDMAAFRNKVYSAEYMSCICDFYCIIKAPVSDFEVARNMINEKIELLFPVDTQTQEVILPKYGQIWQMGKAIEAEIFKKNRKRLKIFFDTFPELGDVDDKTLWCSYAIDRKLEELINNAEKLINSVKKSEQGFHVDIQIKSKVSGIGNFGYYCNHNHIKFYFRKGNSFYIGKNKKMRLANYEEQINIILFYDGTVMEGIDIRGKRTYVPLSFKKLAAYYNKEDKHYVRFCSALFYYLKSTGCKFAKDIKPYIESSLFLPVLTLNDMYNYTSFEHAFGEKYPIKRNWNKSNINLLYAIYNVSKYVDEKSRRIIEEYDDSDIFKQMRIPANISFYGRKSKGVREFIYAYYIKKLGAENVTEEDSIIIRDYINICLDMKEKISLRYNSIKKLNNAHIKLSEKYEYKNMPDIQVPKDSRFKNLRKQLPSAFEWIKTKKRLMREAVLQKHCVAVYAEAINKDICAIYSFVYEPENCRYTLEIREEQGKYQLVQIQKKYNQGCSNEARQYVQQFI